MLLYEEPSGNHRRDRQAERGSTGRLRGQIIDPQAPQATPEAHRPTTPPHSGKAHMASLKSQ